MPHLRPSTLLIALALGGCTQRPPEIGIEKFLAQFVAEASEGEARGVTARIAEIGAEKDVYYLAYIEGDFFCGTGGCPLLLVSNSDSKWNVESKTTIVRLPIQEVAEPQSGLPDISVTYAGGGQLQPLSVVLPFDGAGYAPNPSVAPAFAADSAGRVLISEETRRVPIGPR